MIDTTNLENVAGRDVYGTDGDKIGKAGQIYVDDESGQPEWVTVNTGLFGMNESFVPLREAELSGDTLTVPYSKSQVKDAPNVDPGGVHLSREEEQELYRHYQLTQVSASGYDTDRDVDMDRGVDRDVSFRDGNDTSGPETDDAMTRSEERLRVGTERREAGRARLRKYVVTEQQTVTVPVTREEVRIEREPITDGNVGDAMSGADLSEEEHEVVLHEERPVVEKEVVPVERVKLGKEQVTEHETVTEQVREERIEADGIADGLNDDDRRNRR